MAPAIFVPHSQQLEDGYCLPACVQMVLDFYGQTRPQAEIARMLGLRTGFGVPASNIVKLRIRSLEPQYVVGGAFGHLQSWLWQGIPVIAFVQAGELPQWQGRRAQHAVLLAEADRQDVHLHDPAMTYGPITVPIDSGRRNRWHRRLWSLL